MLDEITELAKEQTVALNTKELEFEEILIKIVKNIRNRELNKTKATL